MEFYHMTDNKKRGSITEAVGSQLKLGSNRIVQISMPNAQRIQLSSMVTSRLIRGNTKRKRQTMQGKKHNSYIHGI